MSDPLLNEPIDTVASDLEAAADGKVPCPDCGKLYMPGPGMGVHRHAAHGSAPRARRRACPECGKLMGTKDMARHLRDIHAIEPPKRGRPPKVESTPLSADEIVSTAASLLWPKGVPHEKLGAVMRWHLQTEQFLSEVSH